MKEFPSTLKHITLWALLGTVIFLAVQAWQARQRQSLFSSQGGVRGHRLGAGCAKRHRHQQRNGGHPAALAATPSSPDGTVFDLFVHDAIHFLPLGPR